MSFKSFSTAQSADTKDKPVVKGKDASSSDPSATKPDKSSSEATAPLKS